MTHVAMQVRDSTDWDVAEHDWASDYDEM
jgi:hypothetical protein